jgi:pimeloyl-ACP methyl ester carboxylesterase/DNA-binding CsgD family transcriptional regulator
MLPGPERDADLALIAREAADGGAQPGRMVREPGGERFILFLPASSMERGEPPRLCVRGYLIDQAVFRALQVFFNPGSGVTDAERRVIFDLVSGASLRDTAQRDGVSVETKRFQSKTAAAKLQCAGQLDLLRLVMAQLSYVAAIAEDEAGEARTAGDFILRLLGRGADLTLERLSDGRLLRCIEMGPADGRPVIAVHGMMFGMLLSGAEQALADAGLRLIMPLRRGYLDPRPVLGIAGEGRLAEESLTDLCDLIERRALGPATVLGQSLGAILALRLAERRPDLVARMILLSINTLRSGAGDPASELYQGYRALAPFSRAITLEFSHHYGDEAAARRILHGMFGASASDIEVLEGKHGSAPVYQWFPELFAGSVTGVADDYSLAMSRVRLPRQTALFLHGSDDPLTSPTAVRAMSAAAPQATLRVLSGAGHFASASHRAQVWSAVSDFIAAPQD